MMDNKKGFTLIELLATLTILGIIMLIAVPNVLGTVERNKKNTYIQDAKKLVSLAEYKMRSERNREKPTNGCGIIYYLNELETGDLSDPPEGGEYDSDTSYVVITYAAGKYVYKVQLVEKVTKAQQTVTRGIYLIDSTKLDASTVEIEDEDWNTNPQSLAGRICKYD